jgi:solute carrier family 25 phosphate transporter 23/24/25/41
MLATYPINLIRTRLQAAGLPANQGTAAAYAGPMDVVRQTAKADGLRGFYRGLLPNMLKVLPATGISYSVFSVVSARVGQG